MSEAINKGLAAAFDEFCLRLLRSTPPDRPGDVHRAVVGLLETRLLRLTMRECGDNQAAAARVLGLHRNTLRQKLRQCKKLSGD